MAAVFPLLLLLTVDLSVARRLAGELPPDLESLWSAFIRTQTFIVFVSLVASMAMALLAARFINRPVQALRTAMARVSRGDLDVAVPVRSTDELGELNEHFNVMLGDLRRARVVGDLFGRYVSPQVAHAALERGVAFGGEVVRATALFDLGVRAVFTDEPAAFS